MQKPLLISLAVCILVGMTLAKGGPGKKVQDVAADAADPANAFAKCLCEVLEKCMPGAEDPNGHKAEGRKSKAAGCMRIANKADTENHLKKGLQNAGLSASAAAGIAKKKAAQHAANAGGTNDRVIIFIYPAPTIMGKSADKWLWLKKVTMHDEINDILVFRNDPTAAPAAGASSTGGAPKFHASQIAYVDVASSIADLEGLDKAAEGKDTSKGSQMSNDGYWVAYANTLENLDKALQDLKKTCADAPASIKAGLKLCKCKGQRALKKHYNIMLAAAGKPAFDGVAK